jgi:hypothetical protein
MMDGENPREVGKTPLADFMEEARRVAVEARERGLVVRNMGAVAFGIHCPKFLPLHRALGRAFSDLDFVSYSGQQEGVLKLFGELGYSQDRRRQYIAQIAGRGQRQLLDDLENSRKVDIFFDRLEMCFVIDFRKRLELDFPTISLADLLLEKMQIVRLTEKDIKDTVVLLREHDVGPAGPEVIDSQYVADLTSKDWGLYYTMTTNLEKVSQIMDGFSPMNDQDKEDVRHKISLLRQEVEKKDKSMQWKMRARLGTKRKWYRDVSEVPE